ncbi:hypothetical protein [Amycolatopsis sp. H20-H5]|uniref:hypothetical protein n=1 Tax=Amycolatopsis sp. H20-H5 TaxID=3046309 RepID=UPI002DBA746B|nr:hypothetical protein [Amycolatopsis sp. H20-H5]MEC3978771.1 hypothetical protein [Amycolatopsis sp. H20-H5]
MIELPTSAFRQTDGLSWYRINVKAPDPFKPGALRAEPQFIQARNYLEALETVPKHLRPISTEELYPVRYTKASHYESPTSRMLVWTARHLSHAGVVAWRWAKNKDARPLT